MLQKLSAPALAAFLFTISCFWRLVIVLAEPKVHKYFDDDHCHWIKYDNAPEIYYINMDRSVDRKNNMESHLSNVGLKHFRVRGVVYDEIYIPDDLEKYWRTAWCKKDTDFVAPSKFEVVKDKTHQLFNYTSIMTGLCGRGKGKNQIKELGCTTSHLMAMKQAIYSITAKSRYALIVEDDVRFPFSIDFDALVATAPPGFGILQLFNSNKDTLADSFQKYARDKAELWHESSNLKFWSTCGYLIDREVMKPIIDAVNYFENGWQYFKVIAGIQGPCAPPDCCTDGKFNQRAPCALASAGFQADSYLYSLTKTYMISTPLIANGRGGDASTFHQDHVELLHKAAFKKQRQVINEMLTGLVPPPPFAKPACKLQLNVSQI